MLSQTPQRETGSFQGGKRSLQQRGSAAVLNITITTVKSVQRTNARAIKIWPEFGQRPLGSYFQSSPIAIGF